MAGAQAVLEHQIEALMHAVSSGGDAGALAAAQNQIGRLGKLQQRIEHGAPAALAAIRAEVMGSVFAAQAIAQQARVATISAQTAEVALHAASTEAHRVTGDFLHDFYERKIFDPYLHFDSPEDEAAYREREAARRQAIEEARAAGTPQGELRATRLAIDQMNDAGAHGADASPEFRARYDQLQNAQASLEEAVAPPSPHPTQASIVVEDPLESIAPAGPADPAILAALRGAGVTLADQAQQGHGVTMERSAARAAGLSQLT